MACYISYTGNGKFIRDWNRDVESPSVRSVTADIKKALPFATVDDAETWIKGHAKCHKIQRSAYKITTNIARQQLIDFQEV